MAKTKAKAKAKPTDGPYFLKLVLYLILGSQWLFLTNQAETELIPIPVGLVLGVIFASHDHFKLDRKIEYAILLVAAFVGYQIATGLVLYVL